jgi:hypothetical protein
MQSTFLALHANAFVASIALLNILVNLVISSVWNVMEILDAGISVGIGVAMLKLK